MAQEVMKTVDNKKRSIKLEKLNAIMNLILISLVIEIKMILTK
jgi:hypothetical protein